MELLRYSGTKKMVVNEIFSKKLTTRAEISSCLQFSTLTISKAVTSLIADNIIIETDFLESGGGRKPAVLAINPHLAYTVAIDIGSYSFKIGIVSLNGDVLKSEFITTYIGETPAQTLEVEQIIEKIQCYFNEYGRDKFISICLGVSGIIDYEKQQIVFCPNISGFDNNDIINVLSARFNIPVYLDSSARCMALGEKLFGHGINVKNQIFISLGYGISSGLIINSDLFRGTSGFSGEIGHLQVTDSNLICTCGNSGCLELYATVPMIIIKVIEQLSSSSVYSPLRQSNIELESIGISDIAKAYRMGDKVVSSVIENFCKLLGRAVAYSVNILNPQLIIFGGGLVEVLPEIIDVTSRFIYHNCLTPSSRDITIAKSQLGEISPIIGSACQMIERYFK